MRTRLEQTLISLAKQRAPHILHQVPVQGGMPLLADALAREGVLVLWCHVPPHYTPNQADLINDWVSAYARLYRLLTDALFPMLNTISAHYIDQESPPIIYLEGLCAPVIRAFSGYVVPYVASRQLLPPNEVEIRGMMQYILEDLEASTIAPTLYQAIVSQAMTHIIHLLHLPITQQTITDFKRKVFQQVQTSTNTPTEVIPKSLLREAVEATRANLPPIPSMPAQEVSAPQPPVSKPEDTPNKRFASEIPIFFDRSGDEKPKRKPPVPNLPKKKEL